MGESPGNQAQGYGPGFGQWVPAGLALVAGPDGLSLVEIAVFVLGAQAEPAQYATAKALTPAEIFSRSAVTLN